MKNFAIMAVVISGLVFGYSMYYEFSVVPESEVAAAKLEHLNNQLIEMEMESLGHPAIQKIEEERAPYYEVRDAKVNQGTILLIVAIATFILSIIPALKKQKIAWFGVLLSLVAFFIAAARATHMFS